ncbi:MAG: alpha/beta hydrolase [Paracoccus denitrificans]|nr:MAG: alpha/beta hydrolase [Paracoccus denitrificans]PZO86002.1 MAG: alpha/beta hydrolase [Paracoccus denitrificans]
MNRRHLLSLLPVLAATPVLAQSPAGPPGRKRRERPPPEQIKDPRATEFLFGPPEHQWRILVGLPDAPPPPDGYSVIFSLDGDTTFPALWNHRAARAPEAPVILFAITYPGENRRWYDLTSRAMSPTQPIEGQRRAPTDRSTGGRDAFLSMIGDDLLPELARRHPINTSDMTLYGHSLGGLFVMHTLLTRPHLFARYVAADPSLWWNAGETQRETETFAGGVIATGRPIDPAIRLLVAKSGQPAPGRNDDMADYVDQLSRIAGLDVTYHPYPKEGHGSLIGPTTADALDLHLAR